MLALRTAIGAAPTYYIYKYSGGSLYGTVIGGPFNPSGTDIAVGDSFSLCAVGSQLIGYRNTVPLSGVVVTDTTYPTGGSPGFGLVAGNTGAAISYFNGVNIVGGLTATMGGSALSAGCTNGPVVTFSPPANLLSQCSISGSTGNPANVWPECSVLSPTTLQTYLCAAGSVTPASQTYNIRILQ
jgi:hypothetical protein